MVDECKRERVQLVKFDVLSELDACSSDDGLGGNGESDVSRAEEEKNQQVQQGLS